MKPVTAGTVVDLPREEVFAFLEPLENHEPFTDHFLKHWEVVDSGHVRVKAAGERVDIRAIEAVAPERLVGEHDRRRRQARDARHVHAHGPRP